MNSVPINDCALISLGAINSAAFATLVACHAEGEVTGVEPQRLGTTDLNRYVLGFARDVGNAKVAMLSRVCSPNLQIAPVATDYETFRRSARLPLRRVAVGVDNNRARWAIQRDWPEILLCAGTHWDTVQISRHSAGGPSCLGCLYPDEDGPDGRVEPTVSFVSAAAGVFLAAEMIKEAIPELHRFRLTDFVYTSLFRPTTVQRREVQRSDTCQCRCKFR